MNKKIKLRIITLYLAIFLVFLGFYNCFDIQDNRSDTTDLVYMKLPNISGFWPNCPRIHIINDNWSATDLDWIQNRTGTYTDPHIIENVTIDAGKIDSCILIEDSSDYFIIKNCTLFNSGELYHDAGIELANTYNGSLIDNTCTDNDLGIYLDNSDNNTILGNTIENNTYRGILVYTNCDNNTISGNVVTTHDYEGIWLYEDCTDNIITGNVVSNSSANGIQISYDCINNNLTGNIVYNNSLVGIFILHGSHNNTISRNIVYDNVVGIRLYSSHYNNVSRNNASENHHGIYVGFGSWYNNISENIVNYNNEYGIHIYNNADNNTIFENLVYHNSGVGIAIMTDDCNFNNITRNIVLNKENNFVLNYGLNNSFGSNYFGTVPPGFSVQLINQYLSSAEFMLTFLISSETGFGPWDKTIQIWWNGVAVAPSAITELGGGYYDVSLTPTFVSSGEEPIVLNMTISASHHDTTYFETGLSVRPFGAINFLFITLVEQIYTEDNFNLTFLVFNSMGDGIDSATFEIYWNDINVSNDLQNLGEGLYFISLEPILVNPDEDPIKLELTIQADGYENKDQEILIGIDPESVSKGGPEPLPGEFPIELIIIIGISIGGMIAVIGMIFLIRRRRGQGLN